VDFSSLSVDFSFVEVEFSSLQFSSVADDHIDMHLPGNRGSNQRNQRVTNQLPYPNGYFRDGEHPNLFLSPMGNAEIRYPLDTF
jgi:hypothetical protein